MTAYLLTNHLLNFMAPAAVLALLLVLLSRLIFGIFRSKRAAGQPWWTQVAIVFIVNVAILTAGLLFFGHDGKMLTYAGLVLGAALCQWVLLRGWKA
ncbi:hypothetical protein [Polaromonas jejuensis]|uniref:Uncharacterized protein n=1 Tax=Polaromonas jejuensis TaxID=457502 RepID=A0ABW0Q8L6_9BURK|nr:hypothetical protein [Polaromonas jejuensis]